MDPIDVAWLGTSVDYRAAWALQESLRARIWAGDAAETILLLEHRPVITLGRSARAESLLVDEKTLVARGIDLVRTSRGGDATYHGLGQLVAYPVVRLTRGLVAHVQALAQAVIEIAAPLGVQGEFRRDRPGVWIGSRKLCAFGLHVSRRVAIHGLALNVKRTADAFSLIVPCGLCDAGVTSLEEQGASQATVAQLAPVLGDAIARALGRSARPVSAASLSGVAMRSPELLSHARSVE